MLAGELSELGTFTDYTDTDGVWETVKENGDTIGQTVWTRYVCYTESMRIPAVSTSICCVVTSHLHSTAVGKRRYCCVVRIGWSFLPPPCCLCPCHDQRHHISESHVFLPDRLVLSSVAFSGMVAGMYWYQYELTGDVTWAVRTEVFLRRRRCLLYTWAVAHEAAQDAVDSWPPLGATFPRICRMHHQASLAEL